MKKLIKSVIPTQENLQHKTDTRKKSCQSEDNMLMIRPPFVFFKMKISLSVFTLKLKKTWFNF